MFSNTLSLAALSLTVSLTLGLRAAHAADEFAFQTPSGNIHCFFDTYENRPNVRCDLAEAAQSYTTAPKDCELDWGFSFYVAAAGRSGLSCVGDTIRDPSAPVLAYGSSVTFAGITCSVSQKGVDCKNKAGRGFSVAKAAQKIY